MQNINSTPPVTPIPQQTRGKSWPNISYIIVKSLYSSSAIQLSIILLGMLCPPSQHIQNIMPSAARLH